MEVRVLQEDVPVRDLPGQAHGAPAHGHGAHGAATCAAVVRRVAQAAARASQAAPVCLADYCDALDCRGDRVQLTTLPRCDKMEIRLLRRDCEVRWEREARCGASGAARPRSSGLHGVCDWLIPHDGTRLPASLQSAFHKCFPPAHSARVRLAHGAWRLHPLLPRLASPPVCVWLHELTPSPSSPPPRCAHHRLLRRLGLPQPGGGAARRPGPKSWTYGAPPSHSARSPDEAL